MHELYGQWVKQLGKRKAVTLYLLNAFTFLRPLPKPVGSFQEKNKHDSPKPSLDMFFHHLLLAYRTFTRNKGSFLINLTGLASALTCVLLIYLWVNDELKMDTFHVKEAQLYQVMVNSRNAGEVGTGPATPTPLANALLAQMPEVEEAVSINEFTRAWPSRKGILTHQDKHLEVKGLHASKDFFSVFSFDLLQGHPDQVLADPTGIVISEELAQKLFNTTGNVVGRLLDWKHASFEGSYRVSGVFKPHPNSSLPPFDVIFSIDVLLEKHEGAESWVQFYADTYVVLKKGTNVEQFNRKIAPLLREQSDLLKDLTLFVQHYPSKYLYGNYENGLPVEGRMVYVRLFTIIAGLILLIACINFINLATAQASSRMKETGVKKALGIRREQLIAQHLVESGVTVLVSLIIAFLLGALLLPQFSEITGKNLSLQVNVQVLLAVLSIAFVTAIIAGLYPAIYLSSFKPVTAVKGEFTASPRELWVRRGLVILQYTLSVVFIGVFIIINQQINFTQTKNLGYNRNNVLTFEWKSNPDNSFNSFLLALKQQPGVVNATYMSGGNLHNDIWAMGAVSWRGDEKDRDYTFKSPIVGYDFIETLGMEMVEGRTFSPEYANEHRSLIINEAARKMMQIEDPVGKIIKVGEGERLIIGVVKDFHYGSLHNHIEPLIFRMEPAGKYVLVRMKPGTEVTTIEKVQKLYKEFQPLHSFDFRFLDDEYRALYASETRLATLTKFFTVLAIILSCLGLFGLADFALRKRFKEVCIRKVLGSSVFNLILMLTADFMKPILIAILIALPASYWIATQWLADFAYRIELEWWIFAGAGLITLLIAWGTVGAQTLKAANANPAKGLKEG